MSNRRWMTVLMGAALACPSAIAAQDTANVPKPQNPLALAEDSAKQILLIMDANKNGMISKEEWMRLMSAEFDRLDVKHNGQLNQHELLQSKVAVRRARPSDLGK